VEVVVVVVVVGSTVVVGGTVVGSSVVVVSVAQQSTDITSYSGEKDKHLKIKFKKEQLLHYSESSSELRSGCSQFHQILHNDRDNQVVVVDGPN